MLVSLGKYHTNRNQLLIPKDTNLQELGDFTPRRLPSNLLPLTGSRGSCFAPFCLNISASPPPSALCSARPKQPILCCGRTQVVLPHHPTQLLPCRAYSASCAVARLRKWALWQTGRGWCGSMRGWKKRGRGSLYDEDLWITFNRQLHRCLLRQN